MLFLVIWFNKIIFCVWIRDKILKYIKIDFIKILIVNFVYLVCGVILSGIVIYLGKGFSEFWDLYS